MIRRRVLLFALAGIVPLAAADAQVYGRAGYGVARPVPRHAAGHAYSSRASRGGAYGVGRRRTYAAYGEPVPVARAYGYGGAFNAGAAQVPPRGFYDGYDGPGATVLRRGVAAQYEPGATQELEPGAKQTATGGPVGGLPGRSGP